jgi:hypothetical protein
MAITRLGSYGQLKGASYKLPCRLATTVTVNLSSPPSSVDGITTAIGDRILVWNQSSEVENGIYVAGVSTWSRAVDFSIDDDVINGIQVYINEGDTNSKKIFVLENTGVITLGITSLVFNPISGGSQSLVIQVTRLQSENLIDTNSLVPGAIYKIIDVHQDLYDDGTNSGTTIFLKALTNNKLSIEGSGLFYNPKYNQSVDEFGIWSNRSSWVATVTGGTFSTNEQVTANNGATGQLVGPIDSNIFISSGGTWSGAASISGDVSGATASVSSIVLKTYNIDDTAIWGGYTWVNLSGNVGTSISSLSLDGAWEKIVYNETDYNISLDIIHYDYENDTIVYREDIAANIVHTTKAFNDLNDEPIHLFQWGNNFKYGNDEGVGSNLVKTSICENVNFSGKYFTYNYFIDSYYTNNIANNGTYFTNNTFLGSSFNSNTIVNFSAIEYNTITDSNISNNSLSSGSFYINKIHDSTISNNIMVNSGFNRNNFVHKTTISYNRLYDAEINNNTLSCYSYFEGNFVHENSYFADNVLENGSHFIYNTLNSNSYFTNNFLYNSSFFNTNTLSVNSSFISNTLNNNSSFDGNTLSDDSSFINNMLNISSFNGNVIPVTFKLQYNTFEKSIIDVDVSAATIIYSEYPKTIYSRPDSTSKIRYYDNADALVIADITD